MVRLSWIDVDGRQVALTLCAGLHTAEERLRRRAPPGASAVRVEAATLASTYVVTPDGRVIATPPENRGGAAEPRDSIAPGRAS